MSVSAAVLIGNSDDKLSQCEWALFCAYVQGAVDQFSEAVHFGGFTSPAARYQTACFVAEFTQERLEYLKANLAEYAEEFRQDSVAVVVGETQFIPAAIEGAG